MQPKKYFLFSFTLTFVLLVASIIGLNILVDPWQYYRSNPELNMESNGRSQNPGIIRNFSFDILVAGTSMAQNFSPEEAGELFGGVAAVLPISGGVSHEQSLTVSMALRHQELKTVVWDIHPKAFMDPAMATKANSFPAYLYDEKLVNDLFYLFNVSNTQKSLEYLSGGQREDKDALIDWRNLQFWGHKRKFGCPHVLHEQMRGAGKSGQSFDLGVQADSSVSDEQIRENIRVNLIQLVEDNPKVEFRFYFPTFSLLYWSVQREALPNKIDTYYRVLIIATELLDSYQNVKLYDYSYLPGISEDLSNYADLVHYSPEINSKVLKMISRDEGRIRAANIRQSVASLDKIAEQYSGERAIAQCLAE